MALRLQVVGLETSEPKAEAAPCATSYAPFALRHVHSWGKSIRPGFNTAATPLSMASFQRGCDKHPPVAPLLHVYSASTAVIVWEAVSGQPFAAGRPAPPG